MRCALAETPFLSLELPSLPPIAGADSAVYNLGNGDGFSPQEMIDTAAPVIGCKFNVAAAPGRAGNPARADNKQNSDQCNDWSRLDLTRLHWQRSH